MFGLVDLKEALLVSSMQLKSIGRVSTNGHMCSEISDTRVSKQNRIRNSESGNIHVSHRETGFNLEQLKDPKWDRTMCLEE